VESGVRRVLRGGAKETSALGNQTVLDKHVKGTLPTNPFRRSVAEMSDSKAASSMEGFKIATEL
jgi:hypothetical protein